MANVMTTTVAVALAAVQRSRQHLQENGCRSIGKSPIIPVLPLAYVVQHVSDGDNGRAHDAGRGGVSATDGNSCIANRCDRLLTSVETTKN